jgi:hypothetical protein
VNYGDGKCCGTKDGSLTFIKSHVSRKTRYSTKPEGDFIFHLFTNVNTTRPRAGIHFLRL